MLQPFEVYCTWLSLQTHFKSSDPFTDKPTYNFIKNNGKIKTSIKAFENRSDYKLFKASKFESTRDVVVCYLSYVSINRGNLPNISELLSWKENETKAINKWIGKIEALDQTLRSDLSKLSKYTLDYLIKPKSGGYPKLIEKWLHGTISIETIILLGRSVGLFKIWEFFYMNTPYKDLFIEHMKLWNAYSYFLNINQEIAKSAWDDWRFLNGK